MGIFPNFRGENKNMFELPPPSYSLRILRYVLRKGFPRNIPILRMGLEPSIFVFFFTSSVCSSCASKLGSSSAQSSCVATRHIYGCFPKIGKHPKMDGENNGKPYENGWFWGVLYHYFRKHPYSWWPSPTTKKQWEFRPQQHLAGKITIQFRNLVCFWTFLRGIPVLNHILGCQCQVALFAQNLYRWKSMDEKGKSWFLHSSLIWNHWGEKSCQK